MLISKIIVVLMVAMNTASVYSTHNSKHFLIIMIIQAN